MLFWALYWHQGACFHFHHNNSDNSDNHFMSNNNSWPECFLSIQILFKSEYRTMIFIEFPFVFVIFQTASQLISFTFVSSQVWRKEISDIHCYGCNKLTLREPAHQRYSWGAMQILLSIIIHQQKSKQSWLLKTLFLYSLISQIPHTNMLQCFNCWLFSQLWSFINNQGKLLTA